MLHLPDMIAFTIPNPDNVTMEIYVTTDKWNHFPYTAHLYMYLYPIVPIKQTPLYPFIFASTESFSLDEKPIESC